MPQTQSDSRGPQHLRDPPARDQPQSEVLYTKPRKNQPINLQIAHKHLHFQEKVRVPTDVPENTSGATRTFFSKSRRNAQTSACTRTFFAPIVRLDIYFAGGCLQSRLEPSRGWRCGRKSGQHRGPADRPWSVEWATMRRTKTLATLVPRWNEALSREFTGLQNALPCFGHRLDDVFGIG
jgi:hypothetical protein